jgi:hypothetical protein
MYGTAPRRSPGNTIQDIQAVAQEDLKGILSILQKLPPASAVQENR